MSETPDARHGLRIEDSDHDRMSVQRWLDEREDAVLLTVFPGEYRHAASHCIKLDRADAQALVQYLNEFLLDDEGC